MASPNFKIRFGKKGVVAVYEIDVDEDVVDALDTAYEVLGLRYAMWVREVDTANGKIVVLPTNTLVIDEEPAVDEAPFGL